MGSYINGIEVSKDQLDTNIDVLTLCEKHFGNVLSSYFDGSVFEDNLGEAHVETYWETPSEKIIEDCLNKVKTGHPAIMHRADRAGSTVLDVGKKVTDKELSYEFIITCATNLEGDGLSDYYRPVRIISNRIENIAKKHPFQYSERRKARFGYENENTLFRNSKDAPDSPLIGIDIYLIRLKATANHV